jgi:ABC-type transport system involved in multi-copper enzyme maturation permease subunit
MTARLLRYARYQVGDYLTQRLVLPVILVAFFAGLPAYMMTRGSPQGFMQSPEGIRLAQQLFTQSVTLFLPLGAFLGAVGVMSADRQQGYFRFLFSKPVNVSAYYAQAYVVHALILVAAFGVITWGFGAYTVHLSVHRAMEAAALTFVLIGGAGLLLGALMRFDAAVLIAIYLLGLIVQQLARAPGSGGLPRWLAGVGAALPPVVKLDDVRNQLYAGTALDQAPLWHVLGYGAACWVLGLLLLRRLSLAR